MSAATGSFAAALVLVTFTVGGTRVLRAVAILSDAAVIACDCLAQERGIA